MTHRSERGRGTGSDDRRDGRTPLCPPPAGARSSARPGRVGVASGTYGISFGALAVAAGLDVWQAQVLSLLMFTGGSQFAFVGIIARRRAGRGTGGRSRPRRCSASATGSTACRRRVSSASRASAVSRPPTSPSTSRRPSASPSPSRRPSDSASGRPGSRSSCSWNLSTLARRRSSATPSATLAARARCRGRGGLRRPPVAAATQPGRHGHRRARRLHRAGQRPRSCRPACR